jgi:hypothetical protein
MIMVKSESGQMTALLKFYTLIGRRGSGLLAVRANRLYETYEIIGPVRLKEEFFISSRISRAALTGSGAAITGRPTTI